ncbi:precorrin-6A synthase (deacetylating) [Microvirga sp. KLBC 81]|uniref:precorrin-6A synthase (deacetylating) n=1 Tax=Microvirga sp. KLBC 81 TaxID=1862707 RepID=UPI000D50A380|nr:precorrin-6A synthase (deacetylating) [Microvirga sp. KLBC 81]PVE23954.1 precorrin-6A synthase (deacetylating) [Microvirga sp. KLBC 81]
MRKIYVIGLGSGNPDHMTIQAIKALNEVDVFFMVDKGAAASELIDVREEICRRFIEDPHYRIVRARNPERDARSADYRHGVEEWHKARAAVFEDLIRDELGADECGAFLVWGDPSLYDSTIRILQHVLAQRSVSFEYEVIPGISSVQALAAAHKIPLNNIGEAVHITTGRKLAEGRMGDAESVVVMLDGENSFRSAPATNSTIYWGAYLGMPDETIIAGPVEEVADRIEEVRRTLREKKGWIMDIYLLKQERDDA